MGAIFAVALARRPVPMSSGERIALVARAGERLYGPARCGRPVRLWSGPSATVCPTTGRGLRPGRAIPIARRVAERGDGGHGGALRDTT